MHTAPPHPLHSLRDPLLAAMLAHVVFDGWSAAALQRASEDCGLDAGAVAAAFPNGAMDALELFLEQADDATEAAIAAMPLATMKIRARITEAVMARFVWALPHREAVRRGLTLLALPQHVPLGLRRLHATVDRIWWAIGDTSTDMNYYSKRALLAGVYSSTLLVWLDDTTPDLSITRAFLERRIVNVMQIEKAKQQWRGLGEKLTGWLPRKGAGTRF